LNQVLEFDALFTAAGPSAREMQGYIFLKSSTEQGSLTAGLWIAYGKTHENGGDTGSIGWGYTWLEKKSKLPISGPITQLHPYVRLQLIRAVR